MERFEELQDQPIINKIDALKGFMPQHEGIALQKWSAIFSLHGSVVEIGTYGGKSSLYLASGAKKNDQIVFTIDHHYGSEEHQIDQEYFDESNYDKSLGRVNTVPLLQKNLSKVKEINNVIPLIGDANLVSRFWQMKIGLLFIDGSHTKKSAENDFNNWQEKIVSGGALVIHDIYENPEEGGQAPYEIFQLALKSGYELFDREDTIVCLKKLIG